MCEQEGVKLHPYSMSLHLFRGVSQRDNNRNGDNRDEIKDAAFVKSGDAADKGYLTEPSPAIVLSKADDAHSFDYLGEERYDPPQLRAFEHCPTAELIFPWIREAQARARERQERFRAARKREAPGASEGREAAANFLDALD